VVVKDGPEAIAQEAVLNECKTAGDFADTILLKGGCFNLVGVGLGSRLTFFRLTEVFLLFAREYTGTVDRPCG
jgi:hypothetical protein